MAGADDELHEVGARWSGPATAARYAARDEHARWSSGRAAGRDPALVAAVLARHGVEPSRGGILDAPCGTGRLRAVLAGRSAPYVGLDASAGMLEVARSPAGPGSVQPARGGPIHGELRLLRGSVARLPFADGCFDVVVCCRLLHHLSDRAGLERVVNELVRVSSRLVLASFWDRASLPAWRRRAGLRRPRSGDDERRVAHSKHLFRELFAAAGAPVVEWRHSFRFVSQQVFAVARKHAARTGPEER